jgi:hypothetical protein
VMGEGTVLLRCAALHPRGFNQTVTTAKPRRNCSGKMPQLPCTACLVTPQSSAAYGRERQGSAGWNVTENSKAVLRSYLAVLSLRVLSLVKPHHSLGRPFPRIWLAFMRVLASKVPWIALHVSICVCDGGPGVCVRVWWWWFGGGGGGGEEDERHMSLQHPLKLQQYTSIAQGLPVTLTATVCWK